MEGEIARSVLVQVCALAGIGIFVTLFTSGSCLDSIIFFDIRQYRTFAMYLSLSDRLLCNTPVAATMCTYSKSLAKGQLIQDHLLGVLYSI